MNKILRDRYEQKETELLRIEESKKKNEELVRYYIALDKYLFSTLEEEIDIGITNDLVGYERSYILLDYTLSKEYSYLTLKLTKNDENFPITFNNIKDIGLDIRDEQVKVWIYMPQKTWRFYLHFDNDVLKNIDNNFKSGKLTLQKEVPTYEKYKDTDRLKYHLEKMKHGYSSRNIDEKLIQNKQGKPIYLVHFLPDDEDYKSMFGATGDIFFVSEHGDEGKLHYSIKEDISDPNRTRYLELIDLIPNENNTGLGSEALKYLEEIALQFNAEKIVGGLSPRDIDDHKDRLIYFYKKNGYRIEGRKINKELR